METSGNRNPDTQLDENCEMPSLFLTKPRLNWEEEVEALAYSRKVSEIRNYMFLYTIMLQFKLASVFYLSSYTWWTSHTTCLWWYRLLMYLLNTCQTSRIEGRKLEGSQAVLAYTGQLKFKHYIHYTWCNHFFWYNSVCFKWMGTVIIA